MAHRYFRVCPRGFANEVTYYRVPIDKAAECEAEYQDFADNNPCGTADWTNHKKARQPGVAVNWADRRTI